MIVSFDHGVSIFLQYITSLRPRRKTNLWRGGWPAGSAEGLGVWGFYTERNGDFDQKSGFFRILTEIWRIFRDFEGFEHFKHSNWTSYHPGKRYHPTGMKVAHLIHRAFSTPPSLMVRNMCKSPTSTMVSGQCWKLGGWDCCRID